MDRQLLFIALVLIPGSSYAMTDSDKLTEIRHGQLEMMKEMVNLKDAGDSKSTISSKRVFDEILTVTEVRQDQQNVMKQIEAIITTADISNRGQNDARLKSQQPPVSDRTSRTKIMAASGHDSKPEKPLLRSTDRSHHSMKEVRKSKGLLSNLLEHVMAGTSATQPRDVTNGNTTKDTSRKLQPKLSLKSNPTVKFSRKHRMLGDRVTIQEGTAVSSNSAGASGNSTPVSEYTTVAARTEGTNKGDMGVRHTVVNQQAKKKMYLTMSTKKKLVQLSLTDKMVAPVIREIPFEISSLAYDSSAHSLLWLSKVNKSAGRFDSHYIPKAVWHFPKSPVQFAIDQANRLLYLLSKIGIETIDLETGKRELLKKRQRKPSGDIKMFANSHKRSVLLSVQRFSRNLVVELGKKSHKIILLPSPIKNAVFLQEGQEFLFCDTKQQLASFSLKTRKKRTMGLKCPPQVVRLLYYKDTLCAITPDRVYVAQVGEGDLTKQLPSQMTPLEVDKDMVSPIAELIEM